MICKKLRSKVLTVALFSILLLISASVDSSGSVSSNNLTYSFIEEFDDENLSNWDIRSEDSDGYAVGASPNHDFQVNSGYLETTSQEYENIVLNYATHESNINYGVWQFDIRYPAIRVSTEFDWQFMLSDDFYGGIGTVLTGYLVSDRTRNGTLTSISPSRIDVNNFGPENYRLPNNIKFDNPIGKEVWNHYDFVITPANYIIFINGAKVGEFLYSDDTNQYRHFSLISNRGSGLKFDNIAISPDYEVFLSAYDFSNDKENANTFWIGIAITTLMMGVISFVVGNTYYRKHSAKSILKYLQNPSNYAFLGIREKDRSFHTDVDPTQIPKRINEYKFLLHPYRLAIMNLLYLHNKLSSIEIKDTLGITWDEYSNTVKSLKKRGYVKVMDDFDDSVVRRFVLIENKGSQDFIELKNLLDLFLNSMEISENNLIDKLYPKNGN